MAVIYKNACGTDSDQKPELQVSVLSHIDSIERIANSINAMTEVPFLQTHWMVPWIKSYIDDPSNLFFIAVYAEKRLVGFAPLYRCKSITRARQLKFIGSGTVSSDFMTFPTAPNRSEEIVDAISKKLHSVTRDWDRIELEGVIDGDKTIERFLDNMRQEGCQAHKFAAPSSLRLKLEDDWTTLIERHPIETQTAIANIERKTKGRVQLHFATDVLSLQQGMENLRHLHQLCSQATGNTGCFDSEQFGRFLNLMAWEELQVDQLWLAWITLDNTPIAANISVRVGKGLYSYQCGESSEHAEFQPARFILKELFQRAISEGLGFVDLLRGEEPIRGKWDCESTKNCRYEIVCRNPRAVVTQVFLKTARSIKGVLLPSRVRAE